MGCRRLGLNKGWARYLYDSLWNRGTGARDVSAGTDDGQSIPERADAVGPTFICVGAMKAGTTSVHSLLGQHPEVFVTTPKELKFWEKPKNEDLEAYHAAFAGSEGYSARGESSVGYGFMPAVPKRLYDYNPGLDPFQWTPSGLGIAVA